MQVSVHILELHMNILHIHPTLLKEQSLQKYCTSGLYFLKEVIQSSLGSVRLCGVYNSRNKEQLTCSLDLAVVGAVTSLILQFSQFLLAVSAVYGLVLHSKSLSCLRN